MKSYKRLYKKLLKELGPEELAETVLFPVKLTAKQQKEAAEQLAAARKKSRESLTEETKNSLRLYHLRFRIEDYVDGKEEFNPEFTFGFFLKRYVELLEKKRKDFAEEISIDETLLSQLINNHRMPPDYITIRLEIHSDNIIPAAYWIRLVEKQRLHEISTDTELRNKEKKFVTSIVTTKQSA
jgi:plasmid maintenance system antidote protein VapI